MQHSAEKAATPTDHAAISDVVGIKEQTWLQRVFASQAFWVTVALFVLVAYMTMLEPSFGTVDNVANMTRNFAPFGIMALGMTVVIITGGIDLSVGSIMGLVAIVAGLFLTWHYPWYVAFGMGIAGRPRLRRVQRLLRRLCRHAVLRGDARHAVDRAVVGGRLLGQSDALPVRARCADRQGDRPGELAASDSGRFDPRLDTANLDPFLGR